MRMREDVKTGSLAVTIGFLLSTGFFFGVGAILDFWNKENPIGAFLSEYWGLVLGALLCIFFRFKLMPKVR